MTPYFPKAFMSTLKWVLEVHVKRNQIFKKKKNGYKPWLMTLSHFCCKLFYFGLPSIRYPDKNHCLCIYTCFCDILDGVSEDLAGWDCPVSPCW